MGFAINILFVYLFITIPFYILRKIFDYIAEEIEIRINHNLKNKENEN